MRTRIIILLLLSISVFHSSYAQQETDDEPAPLRKTGCSNPKFIAAEQKAYQELFNERARIDKWRVDTITRIEGVKKEELDRASSRYSATLNACKDAECSSEAKVKYDDDVLIALAFRDKCLKIVRRRVAEKYKEAQDVYDQAVSDAIKLYCHAFEATGKVADGVYSGAICDLEKKFTVICSIAALGIEYDIKFVPSTGNARAGTFSFYTKWKMVILEGNGSYTIEGGDTDKPKILMNLNSKVIIPKGPVSGGGPTQIDLVPLRTNECEGK